MDPDATLAQRDEALKAAQRNGLDIAVIAQCIVRKIMSDAFNVGLPSCLRPSVCFHACRDGP